MSDKKFEHRVLAAEAQAGDLTSASTLFLSEDFRFLHAEPLPHMAAALELLGSPVHTEQQKQIAALAMQRLPLQSYVQFALALLALREVGVISPGLFRRAVFPTYEWNTKLAESYDHEAVADALSRMVGSSAVDSGTKRYIREEILSGKAKIHILDLRDAGQIP